MAELKDYKEKVFAIMRDNESARNDDWLLIAHYVRTYMPHVCYKDQEEKLCLRLRDLDKFPSAETLIRARRIIQNDDAMWLPTDPKVTKARRIKEQNYHDAEVREARQHIIIS